MIFSLNFKKNNIGGALFQGAPGTFKDNLIERLQYPFKKKYLSCKFGMLLDVWLDLIQEVLPNCSLLFAAIVSAIVRNALSLGVLSCKHVATFMA
ncbi:MAG: hypothetical protein KJ990_03565 [Proteobacteria bacterium]|nr:hypothetical protein [Pseudomonadota bacterium]MBU1649601.1 hypothetical protein [Pseudomonadota bacterium]